MGSVAEAVHIRRLLRWSIKLIWRSRCYNLSVLFWI